jgi:hypothetical protein
MSWTVRRGTAHDIIVSFEGHLSSADGARSAHEFVEALGRDTLDVCWDVREMSGYDTGARKAWQSQMLARRRQIRSITLIGGSALVRMGASAIGLVLGIKCQFADTPPE